MTTKPKTCKAPPANGAEPDPVFAAIVRGGSGVALVILILSEHAQLIFRSNVCITNRIAILVQYASGYHAERQHFDGDAGLAPRFYLDTLAYPAAGHAVTLMRDGEQMTSRGMRPP